MKQLIVAMVCLFGFSSPLLAEEMNKTAGSEGAAAGEAEGAAAAKSGDQQDEAVAGFGVPALAVSAGAAFAALISAVAKDGDGSTTSHTAVTHNPSNY